MKRIGRDYTQKQQHLAPLVNYILKRNENNLIYFLEQKGYNPQSPQELKETALYWIGKETRKGNFKKAIKELYAIHPDRQAILDLFGKQELLAYDEPRTPKEDFLKKPIFRVSVFLLLVLLIFFLIAKLTD